MGRGEQMEFPNTPPILPECVVKRKQPRIGFSTLVVVVVVVVVYRVSYEDNRFVKRSSLSSHVRQIKTVTDK